MTLAAIHATASGAARAYAQATSGTAGQGTSGFGATLQHALEGAVEMGRQADAKAVEAASGGGNLTDVVAAVSKAELALQTTVAIRDRVVQAYQDIMRMPI